MIYLDNAATTYPKPERVYNAVLDCMKNYCANPGRAGHKLAMRAAREIYDTRENIAKLFNVSNPMNIVFTSNATDSLNLAIKGVLQEGDHVITTSMEHNSVIRPIKALEKRGIENTVVKCDYEGFLDYEDLEKSIKSNTKLIVTTHASNVCGTLIDIKKVGEIAKKHNILFLVDASQTAGVYDIDVNECNIDMLAMPGHKCLFGPQGTGILYVREGLNLNILKEGGTGSKSEEIVQPELFPDKYESGTHNTPGIAGLNQGILFIFERGINNIRQHEEELCQYMIDKLEEVPDIKIYGPKDSKKRASVIALNIGDMDSGEVTFLLDSEYNIATRSGIHCSPLAHTTLGTLKQGAVRFSIGYFNTKDEIDKAVEALKKISKNK
ncbi:TPA: aminotransferase class V-fold PLP-dependent enzyme [Clostridioides difficile]|uniref:aminotransferase class V-fold PLP-dependent enzyme n=1 Tax=Clostridioides difficile TaxID=1496 RepID=UPI0002F90C51|nr:aminotransferase class V-fold PLP-dependent enzyme [Clostridioides difficile]AXU55508.1 selenocysteine lyase [Clostridioides difficile]EGT2229666.1 aminotransferase class V-fold PLP-dependent enzyme [Clostridioides difficile]EGT3662515.1 aminotransferase class V-fold PLP-dependent enzyme [Clostridioides difficile]EGT3686946.1 aminotransferase class V-fold PLP-dependent enzyme [Clostridioides difficile]EGT3735971.1 aminotransferase class V-fold PLP-dependent enzyme [Clostridioides difficile]